MPETTILANVFWDRYENSDCSRHKLGGAIIANFWKPPLPQAMLKATKINRTVHKHSNLTTLHGGGGVGRYFVLSFGICLDIFGQDCRVFGSFDKRTQGLKTFNT